MTVVLLPLAPFSWEKWTLNSTYMHGSLPRSLNQVTLGEKKEVSKINAENIELLILFCSLNNIQTIYLSFLFLTELMTGGGRNSQESRWGPQVLRCCAGLTAEPTIKAAQCCPSIPQRTSNYSSGLTIEKRWFLLALNLLPPNSRA